MKYQNKVVMLTFFFLVSAAGFSASYADEDNLYLWTKGAQSAVVYSLDRLDKITFDDTFMSVWTNGGKTDYAYSSIAFMSLQETVKPVTGVAKLPVNDSDMVVSFDREAQLVRVDGEKAFGGIAVCDLQGREVLKRSRTATHQQLSVADLPRGVYIVKPLGTSKSVKIIK